MRLLLIAILCSAFLFSCKEEEPEIEEPEFEDTLKLYDLFPLKVGNKFYYTYSYVEYGGGPIIEYIKGTDEWTVVSESTSDIYKIYTIQQKFNAIVFTIPNTGDTTIIEDEISTQVIYEKKSSSMINYKGFVFKRYQIFPEISLSTYIGTNYPYQRVVFKADSGLVFYNYYNPPNHVESESLFLDSIKFVP